LAALGAGCSLLSTLNLRYCKNISDDGVIEFAQHHRNVKVIDLRDCPGITDRALSALAETCHDLESLNVSGCSISDSGVLEIAKCCKKIKALDLRSCSSLSDSTLWTAIHNFPDLKTLHCSGCQKITNSMLYRIKQHFPSISLSSN
jgi:F-box and leucine-rich repeat protein 2/20